MRLPKCTGASGSTRIACVEAHVANEARLLSDLSAKDTERLSGLLARLLCSLERHGPARR